MGGRDLMVGVATMTSREIADVGHVYVVESTNGKSVKIGKSKEPEVRVKTIQRMSNSSGRTWISSRQFNASKLETKCHRANAAARMAGEWFAMSFESAVACVESLCGAEAPCVKKELREDREARSLRVFDAINAHFKGGTK